MQTVRNTALSGAALSSYLRAAGVTSNDYLQAMLAAAFLRALRRNIVRHKGGGQLRAEERERVAEVERRRVYADTPFVGRTSRQIQRADSRRFAKEVARGALGSTSAWRTALADMKAAGAIA